MAGMQQFMAFAETAKHGSFAAAARELGAGASTLAKAVARLETSLGVKLFHRTTRQVSLTADGERLFQRCQRVLAEIDELHADAAGARAAPGGTLRASVPIVYGKRVMVPLLARLLQQHPGLALDLRLDDGYVDLVKEGFDLAVRVGELQDSGLVAQRFDSQQLVLCASPAYLARAGTPRGIEALKQLAVVAFRLPSTGRSRAWQLRSRGQALQWTPQARVQVNDGEGLIAAVLQGLGVAQVPDYMVEDELRDGRLVELLPGCRPAAMPISAVYPSGRLVPPRVRALLALLKTLKR
ncbi:LysR family transcriptional regulator [Aquabacterium sp.]|uniref:LysR family transcriptional regulator n=1 Tax=Aquabacterium sp. TaxID=1872578 RepID=UPI003783CFBC